MTAMANYVPTVISDECILWKGPVGTNGYGQVSHEGKTWAVHRLMFYLQRKSEFKPHLICCHKCDNKLCVNVKHLYMGTVQDNMSDKALKEVPWWQRPESRPKLVVEQQKKPKKAAKEKEQTLMNKSTRTRRETAVITVRLYKSQIDALKSQNGVTASALAKALFQLYLTGAVPSAFKLAKSEMEAAQKALASSVKGQTP